MDDRISKLQWAFLEKHIQASKLDYYQQQKVSLKGKFTDNAEDVEAIDQCLKEWSLKEVLHGEDGSKPYRCHCGKRIRHLYVVQHTTKDVTLHLGSTCFKSYVGINAEMVEKVKASNEVLIAEKEEIIGLYEVGYIEEQKFLLDYEALDKDFREQLDIGLPLSRRQEKLAYQELDIEDKGLLVTRRDLIRSMSREQLIRMNSLTIEGRRTIIARLVDGRILGVLDEVLAAAPELFSNRKTPTVDGGNRLELRLIEGFKSNDHLSQEERIGHHYEGIATLIQMVDYGVVAPSVLVKVASALLSESQRSYWLGHTSAGQKRELSRHILLNSHMVSPEVILGYKNLPKDIVGQIMLRLPLTEIQYNRLQDYLKQGKD